MAKPDNFRDSRTTGPTRALDSAADRNAMVEACPTHNLNVQFLATGRTLGVSLATLHRRLAAKTALPAAAEALQGASWEAGSSE